jgi:DNA-binding transcriptional LysR family regulator
LTVPLHVFLLAGDGVLMTNHSRVAADVAAGRLVRILPDWEGPEPALYAVRPGGRVQPPKVKAFLDFLVPRLDLTGSFPVLQAKVSG